METEIWKPVIGYEWRYEVSNIGNIRSNYRWKYLKNMRPYCNRWYLQTILWWKYASVHRLVAIAFISNPENKKEVNHKNWIKSDNRLENLEWLTTSENQKHSYKYWLNKVTENNYFIKNNPFKWKFGKNHYLSKNISQYTLDWEFFREWDSISDISREFWISISGISRCCNWKQKTAGGFIWKFIS